VPVNFLDNHDVGRFLFKEFFHTDTAAVLAGTLPADQFDATRDARLKTAYVFLFTEQGIPCVYYGDEQGFEGGNDPANREDLWQSGYVQAPQMGPDPVTGITYGRFYPWIQRLTTLRKKYKAFTRGDQKVVWATDHTGKEMDAGIFAFERAGGDAMDGYALVVLNTSRQQGSPTDGMKKMAVSIAASTMLVDVLPDKPVSYQVAGDQTLAIQVPALGAAVLVPQSQMGGN
jgi:glycosidase